MTKVVVTLGLQSLSIAQKIEKTRFIVTSMTGNAFFAEPNPLPTPPLATLTADVNALETAYIAAQAGGKQATALMRAREVVVDRDFTALAAYVEMVANTNFPMAETIVRSAGMGIKQITPPVINDFEIDNTEVPGEIKLKVKSVRGASYIYQMCNDPSIESNWQLLKIIKQAKLVKDGLTSGSRYYFRVATIDKSGQLPWSNVLNIIAL